MRAPRNVRSRRWPVSRRDFLGTSLAAGALAGWDLRQAQAADPNALVVEGYAGPFSVQPGEQVGLHLSTNAPRVSVEIARVGLRREVVWRKEDVKAELHAVPAGAAMQGCKWPAALQVDVSPTWRSGIYSIVMEARRDAQRKTAEAFFVVRPDKPSRDARILFQISSNTYQAYNNWGGSCLYSGPNHPRVSFDRPFLVYETPLRPGATWFNPNTNCYHTWDEPFIQWAERAGYAIDYCANLDLEAHPELLEHYRLVLSVGHDEYWSAGMRDALERYVAGGGNAFFMSGNSICWQVRVEDDGRALVCYKRAHDRDPVFQTDDRRNLTTLWSDPLLGRPENQLSGVGFTFGGYNGLFGEFMQGPGAGEYTVHRPEHWILAGTGLTGGETFGGQANIAGYECDGCEHVTGPDGRPVPTGRDGTPPGFQIVATTPARWSKADGSINWIHELRRQLGRHPDMGDDWLERNGAGVLGTYTRGGTVVTVGSCDWPYGLHAGDRVVDRIVRNVLDRLSQGVT